MSRRRHIQYPSMTSLLDVVLILMFAALVQSAARADEMMRMAEEQLAQQKDPTPPPAIPAELEAQRQLALDKIGELEPIFVAVDSTGTQVTVQRRGGEPKALGVTLYDAASGGRYVPHSDPSRSVCALVRQHIANGDLSDYLIIIRPSSERRAYPFALYSGLIGESSICATVHSGIAVFLDQRPGAPHRKIYHE